ncbi:MAG: hypothetical protein NT145_06115 [Elusimicrobia bacterium]|nr:hypothetical protein [Elusimicrobiota bacterium]
MKKIFSVVLCAVLFTSVSVFLTAEETAKKKEPVMGAQGTEKEMMSGCMMGKGMMEKGGMKGMCPMHGMMMGQMMGKSMIASGDGGVIVMMGNKLMKYDKDLNLVKEAEIKVDEEAMQKMMEMCNNCPMCKEMKEQKGMGKGSPKKK